MPGAARLGDIASGHGCFPATPITSGSPDVLINNIPAARKGDTVQAHACLCSKKPHGVHSRNLSGGSNAVFINGLPAARLGDAINCGGVILSASSDVIIG